MADRGAMVLSRFRFLPLALLLVLLGGACPAPDDPGLDGGGGDGGSADGGGSDGGDPDGGVQLSADELYWREILAGGVDAATGLAELAERGGFPLEVEGGFLFAYLDDRQDTYALAGDFEGWTGLPMTLEAGVWWIVVPIPSPDGAKYKFVREFEDLYLADPLARRYGHDEFGEFSLVRSSGAHLERMSAGGSRGGRIRLWVPAGAIARHLYVQDGQNLFDPASFNGGWRLQESVGAGTLVVGIDNLGTARMDEYTHVADDGIGTGGPIGGGADAYTDWIVTSLIPQVEARYGAAPKRGAMGSSLGGLVSLHLWMRHPTHFAFVGSLSGTMGWGSLGTHTGETIIERLAGQSAGGVVLYLDSGGGPGSGCVDSDGDGIQDDAPDAADNYCENRQLADQLAADGWTWDQELHHWWELGAAHDEQAWAARVHRPLAIFEAP
ncbi:MAG: alpha/beta hydrolase-fold protein [Deltaproteobacteria bacterium]|nr:alpha/beta hydrolase-fold protein [Deltaproteobacteria bacterium]